MTMEIAQFLAAMPAGLKREGLLLLLLVWVGVGASVALSDRRLCNGYEFFYDHGTENCERCREICTDAQLRGTEEQCSNNCPRYQLALKCEGQEGWFFDESNNSCRSCCVDCFNAPDPSPLCQSKCSDFLASFQTDQDLSNPTKQGSEPGPDAHVSSSPCGLRNETKIPKKPFNNNYDQNVIVIVVIILAVVVCIIVILAAFGVIRHITAKAVVVTVRQAELDHGGLQSTGRSEGRPIEESKRTQQHSVVMMAADGTLRTMTFLAPKTAFADLSVGHAVSHSEAV